MNAPIKLVLAWAGLISSMCFIGSASAGASAESSAQAQKPVGLSNFEAIAAGKRQFLIHGEVKPLSPKKVAVLCGGFESVTCDKTLRSYNGMRGVLVADSPSYRNDLYSGYPALLENGEHVVYRIPNWQQFDNIFDASEYIFDTKDIERAQAMVNKPLSPSVAFKVLEYLFEQGAITLVLDTGERPSLTAVTQRLALLDGFVGVQNHERVFSAMNKLTLQKQEEGQWALIPLAAQDMPLYGDLKIGRLKQLRMVANYWGAGGINFNEVEVALAGEYGEPLYARKFELSQIKRSSSSRGVSEQALIPATKKEAKLLATLANKPALITLSGRFPLQRALTREQSAQLRAVLDIYALLDLPETNQLAVR